MKHTWLFLTVVPFAVYADMVEEQAPDEKKVASYEALAKESLRQRAQELSALLQDEEKKEVAVVEEAAAPQEQESSKEVTQESAAEIQMTGQKRSLLRPQQKKEQRTPATGREKQEEQEQLKPAHEALTPKRKEVKQAAAQAEQKAAVQAEKVEE